MVPVIYTRLRELTDWFETGQLGPCKTFPDVFASSTDPMLEKALLTLLHHIAHLGLPACVTALRDLLGGAAIGHVTCACTCEHEPLELGYPALSDPLGWVRITKDTGWLWPADDSEESWESFRTNLDMFSRAWFGADDRCSGEAVLYSLSAEFRRDLLEAGIGERQSIVEALARRLYMTRSNAASDGSLQDKAVRGSAEERRFRVTDSARIHYRYEDGGAMALLRYYPPGKHDQGLR